MSELVSLNRKLARVEKRIRSAEQQRDEIEYQIQEIHEGEALEYIRNMNGEPDWSWILADGDGSCRTRYDLRKWLARKLGFDTGGYWGDTMQDTLPLQVIRGSLANAGKVRSAVEYIAPYITRHDDGCVWFSLYQDADEREGAWELRVNPTTWVTSINRQYYGAIVENLEFESLGEALVHCSESLWTDLYEGGEDQFEMPNGPPPAAVVAYLSTAKRLPSLERNDDDRG